MQILLNLALPPIKQLKIQTKIQLIYIQIQIYLQNEQYCSLGLGTIDNHTN